jgi:hypothetical protein
MKRLLTLALLVLALVACGSASANTGTAITPIATPTATATDTPTPTPTPETHFKVGQTVKVGIPAIWQITITKAVLTKGGQYDQPPAGTQYLVLSLSLKNVSSTEQSFYGFMTLRDPQGQSMNFSYVSTAAQMPQGKVEAGGPLQGDLTYSVPTGVHSFTLSYEISPADPGQTIWDIHV